MCVLFSYYLGKPRARAVPWRIWKRFETSFLHGRNWIYRCRRIPIQLFRKHIHSDEEVRKLILQIFALRTFIFLYHIVEKPNIYCHLKNIPWNQLFLFRKKLLSRNFCEKMVTVKFHNFHTSMKLKLSNSNYLWLS